MSEKLKRKPFVDVKFLENGKMLITSLTKEKKEIKRKYKSIFSAIRSYIYALENELSKEQRNRQIIEGLMVRASYLIELKNQQVRELEKLIGQLKIIKEDLELEKLSKKEARSKVNKVIVWLKEVEVVDLKKLLDKFIPIFNKPENLPKIKEYLKEFIEKLEEKLQQIKEEERQQEEMVKKDRNIKNIKVKRDEIGFVTKTKNKFGEDLFMTLSYYPDQNEVKIRSRFIQRDELRDYSELLVDENTWREIVESVKRIVKE